MKLSLPVIVNVRIIISVLLFSFLKGYLLLFASVGSLIGWIICIIGLPSQVGYMFAGAVLGPSGADIVPFPTVLEWIITIAIVLDAGLDTEFVQFEKDGEEIIVNALGVILMSILAGIGIVHFGLGLNVKNIIALIACMYPAGKSFAIAKLKSGGMENTPTGYYIGISCALDDIIPLILALTLQLLPSSNGMVFEESLPLVYTIGLLIVVGSPIILFLPEFIDTGILSQVPKGMRFALTLCLMIVLMTGLLVLSIRVNASHLVTAFITGLTFSQVHTFRGDCHQSVRRNFFICIRNIFFATKVDFR